MTNSELKQTFEELGNQNNKATSNGYGTEFSEGYNLVRKQSESQVLTNRQGVSPNENPNSFPNSADDSKTIGSLRKPLINHETEYGFNKENSNQMVQNKGTNPMVYFPNNAERTIDQTKLFKNDGLNSISSKMGLPGVGDFSRSGQMNLERKEFLDEILKNKKLRDNKLRGMENRKLSDDFMYSLPELHKSRFYDDWYKGKNQLLIFIVN